HTVFDPSLRPIFVFLPCTTLFRSESLVVSRDGRLLDHRDALSSALQTDGVLVQDYTGALLQCPKDGTPAEVNWSNPGSDPLTMRSEEHTSELQSRFDLGCRLLLEN